MIIEDPLSLSFVDGHLCQFLFELQGGTLRDSGFLTWDVDGDGLDTKLGVTCSIPGDLTGRSTGARVEFGTDEDFKEKLTHKYSNHSERDLKVQDGKNKLWAYYILTPYNNRYCH